MTETKTARLEGAVTCTGWMFGIRDCDECPPIFKDGCGLIGDDEDD